VSADVPYVRVGRSALVTSSLWLGTVNFSGRVDDDDALALLDHARDRGVNCVDTADIYGWRLYKGHTEELLGRWLAQGGGRREDTVVATKVGSPMGDGVLERGLSARHVVAGCEASLRRLGVDHVDLLQMHEYDPTAPWDEVWQAMETLVASGKVRYVGSSNFAGWQIAAGEEAARRRQGVGTISHQCLYNLARRDVELEVLPAAEAYGVGVFAWSPLHGGLLSGALDKLRRGVAVKSAQGRAQELLPAVRPSLESFEATCREHGLDPAEAALAWLLDRPGVTGAVIGPRTPEQLDSALRAASTTLDASLVAALETIFPPPAPVAAPWAWMG
jgi:NDP-hexose 2,3-enoyl reductase